LKRFVKIGGEMVSLVQVKTVLAELLPEDVDYWRRRGSRLAQSTRIVAAVTRPIEEKKILKKMADLLPSIAIPKQFLVMEDLPKMGSGKIDFRSITDMVRRGSSPVPNKPILENQDRQDTGRQAVVGKAMEFVPEDQFLFCSSPVVDERERGSRRDWISRKTSGADARARRE